jgi:hypothetical protein
VPSILFADRRRRKLLHRRTVRSRSTGNGLQRLGPRRALYQTHPNLVEVL